MTHKMRHWLLGGGILLGLGTKTQPNVKVLSNPNATITNPFTRVDAVRELANGSVLVLDSYDRAVHLVDFTKNTTKPVGRNGSGPGEYQLPTRLFPLGKDSSAVFDMGNRRLLVILPDASLGGFLNPAGADVGQPLPRGLGTALKADDSGLIYGQGSSWMNPSGADARPMDSLPIERWRVRSTRRDTVAYLPRHWPAGSEVVHGVVMNPSGFLPLTTQPQWDVAPDGRVAIVHDDPYRIDLVSGDRKVQIGQPLRYSPLKITEEHKRQWRAYMNRPRPAMIMSKGATRPVPGIVREPGFTEPAKWPEYLPPFLNDAVRFARDGTLWIQRTTPVSQPPTFDLIDPNGRVVAQVKLPLGSRLVGFGKGWVYVVRIDPDDLEFLERYSYPASTRP